ncbi:MAG: 30S ribosomal protein S13 [Thermoplasmata archaeon]
MSIAPKDPKEGEASETPAAPEAPVEAERTGKKEKGPKTKEGKDGKEGKEGKGKTPKAGGAPGTPKKGAKKAPDNPNFRYIVRIAESDLDGLRATSLALSSIRGVGLRTADVVCRLANVDAHEMIGNLPEPTVEAIETLLGELPQKVPIWMVNHPKEYAVGAAHHFIAGDLETSRRDDVNLLKMIRSYKGVRHERGQKVRGQRTRSNGRTGMAAGVLKKAAKEAAQTKEKEGAPAAAATPAPAATPAAAAPAKKA